MHENSKRIMMKRLAAVLIIGALATSTLAGRGSSTASNAQANTTVAPVDKENIKAQGAQSGAQGVQPEAGSSETPITDNSEKTICVIVKVLGNQYWSILQASAEQADKDLGCKVVVVGTTLESDIEGQLILLRDVVSAQAAGIVIAPLDSASLDVSIIEVYNSGTPVMLVDTATRSDNYSTAPLANNVEAGKTVAEETTQRLKAKGFSEDGTAQIAIWVGSTGSQTINNRVKGFNEYWEVNAPEKQMAPDDDVKVNEGDTSRVAGSRQDLITTYPDLKGVLNPNNGSTVDLTTGLTESKRADIAMVGFDFSAEIKTMIRSNEYDVASVVRRQYFMGYDRIEITVELADGQTVRDKTINTGTVLAGSKNVDFDKVQGITHLQMIP